MPIAPLSSDNVPQFSKKIISGALRTFSPHIDALVAESCSSQAFSACSAAVASLRRPGDLAILAEQAVKCCAEQALALDVELRLLGRDSDGALAWREAISRVALLMGAGLERRALVQLACAGPSWLSILMVELLSTPPAEGEALALALSKAGPGPAGSTILLIRACLPASKSLFSPTSKKGSLCSIFSRAEHCSEIAERNAKRWLSGAALDPRSTEEAANHFSALWLGGSNLAPAERRAEQAAEALRSSYAAIGSAPVDLFAAAAARAFSPPLGVNGAESSWPKSSTQKLTPPQALFLVLAAPEHNAAWAAWAMLRLAEPSPDLLFAAAHRLSSVATHRKALGAVCLSMAKQLNAADGGILAPSVRASRPGPRSSAKLGANIFELLCKACLVNQLPSFPDEMPAIEAMFSMLAQAGFDPFERAQGAKLSSMEKVQARNDLHAPHLMALLEKFSLEAASAPGAASSAPVPRL